MNLDHNEDRELAGQKSSRSIVHTLVHLPEALNFVTALGYTSPLFFDEEVRVSAAQRTEGLFITECGDELKLDYAIVSVVVKSLFCYRKDRASVNVLNTEVGAKYLITIVRLGTTQPHRRTVEHRDHGYNCICQGVNTTAEPVQLGGPTQNA
jgi:hypothetical protein